MNTEAKIISSTGAEVTASSTDLTQRLRALAGQAREALPACALDAPASLLAFMVANGSPGELDGFGQDEELVEQVWDLLADWHEAAERVARQASAALQRLEDDFSARRAA